MGSVTVMSSIIMIRIYLGESWDQRSTKEIQKRIMTDICKYTQFLRKLCSEMKKERNRAITKGERSIKRF